MRAVRPKSPRGPGVPASLLGSHFEYEDIFFILMVGGGWGATFWFFKSHKIYIYCSLGIYLTGNKRNPCTNILMGFKI